MQIPLLSALHKAIHAFAAIDEALDEENGWTVPTMALFEAVFERSKGLVSK